MDYASLLEELTQNYAVSGNEECFSKVVKQIFSKYYDDVAVDHFFNVLAIKKGKGKNPLKILITAHYDEIGFLVKTISEDGFLRISPVGGIDTKILPAKEVLVHGTKTVFGVIGAKPPHLLKPEEVSKPIKMDDLYVDIGLDEKSAREIIQIGDVVTFKSSITRLFNNKVASKTMDNRAGLAAMVGIMKELEKFSVAHEVYFMATTQEETHLTGVITGAYRINPDLAIVLDTCHGEMPDVPKDEAFPLGKGPAIAVGPNLHKKATRKLMDIAKDNNINYHSDIIPGDTGTEAWAIQVSRNGVPTVLVEIPLRYMHTQVETVSLSDLAKVSKLVAHYIAEIENGEELLC